MSRNIYRDGQNRSASIRAVPNLHDALSFRYRPLMPEEVEELEGAVAETKNRKQSIAILAAAIAGKIVDWSEVDADGKSIPVSADAIRHLLYPVFNKLYRIVAGLQPGDEPAGNPEERSEYVRDLLEGAGGHRERTEKN